MRRVAGLLFFAVAAACSDHSPAPPTGVGSGPPSTTPPVVRPSPIAGTVVVSSPVVVRVGATTQSVVYVSLPSNQVYADDKVLITNLASNLTVAPRILRGGFDPVTIPANLGDVIDVSLAPAPSGPVTDARITVSPGQPLRVIRTDPINSTDDVEVDATVSVTFSEPLDSAPAAGRIRLLRAGQSVPASLSFDSTRTRVTLRPTEALVSGESYRVDVGDGVVGVTGAPLAGGASATFTTVPLGDANAVEQVTGTWDATSWRFTDVDSPGAAIWDDPVVGWGPNAYYRIHLVIAASPTGPPGTITWRMEMTWQLPNYPGSATIAGFATVGTTWLLGRTTTSPWLREGRCEYGYLCPLQDLQDFRRDGDVLTVTRRAYLLYVDGINYPWPARETLTLKRATP